VPNPDFLSCWNGLALSEREREVLSLVAAGLKDKQISSALHISRRTVGHHVDHILTKLGTPSRASAVAVAIRSGVIA
jgi:DNA-binding NarL/FixJ family response regulator